MGPAHFPDVFPWSTSCIHATREKIFRTERYKMLITWYVFDWGNHHLFLFLVHCIPLCIIHFTFSLGFSIQLCTSCFSVSFLLIWKNALQVMTVLMISGCAAATAVGYLGKYGQREAFWNPFCSYVTKFCHQMLISTVLSYLAFFCYLALNILAAYKLMSHATEWLMSSEE